MKILISILAVFLSIGMANAQDKEPTMDETLDYINKIWRVLPQLEISDTWNFNPKYTSDFTTDSWRTSSRGRLSCEKEYARYSVTYEYQAKDFEQVMDSNPEWTIKTNGIEVGFIVLKAKAKTIRVIEKGFQESYSCQVNNTDRLLFYYNKSNPGEKERLIKALNHFVKLTRKNEKPDPFG